MCVGQTRGEAVPQPGQEGELCRPQVEEGGGQAVTQPGDPAEGAEGRRLPPVGGRWQGGRK